MGFYTRTTRAWLDQRFAKHDDRGVYFAHMPIYGLGHAAGEGGHVGRYARFLRILAALDGIECGSVLDVGGAEGYLAHVVQTLFGVPAASTDLSLAACHRARELFGVPAAAVDSARLPFGDGTFDVVVCSEVLEHVEHPVETLLELQRVARVAVIMTTEEVRYDRAWLDDYLFRRPGWPHMERNLFHPDDLAGALPGARLQPQCDAPPPPSVASAADATAWILANTRGDSLQPGRIGVVATVPTRAFRPRPRTRDDATLLAQLLATHTTPGHRSPPPSPERQAAWLRTLRAPGGGGAALSVAGETLRGDRTWPMADGVPDFVDVDAPPLTRDALVRRIAALPGPHRDALLALRDRLHLPERWPQDSFDLRQRDQRRGFWPNDQLAKHGDGFRWRATGNDPWVVTPFLDRPLRACTLTMRFHAPEHAVDAATGQVFWKGPADETFTEERSVKFPLRNDGATHTYRVPLVAPGAAPIDVQWLRLDLADGPGEIDLDELRLEA